MNKKPFFSIIVPTYNQGHFLKKNLESLFLQSFKNFEIIVIDNYSNDSTKEIVNKYKKKIKYFKIKNNGIISKSRNFGLKKSKGEWIAFLDSDDYWTRNKLQVIFNFIKKKKFNVICNNEWKVVNYKKKKIAKYGPYNKKNFYKYLLLNGNCLSTSASVIEKKFLIKNKIFFKEKKSYITAEDYDFFLNISLKKGVFYFLDDVLGYHTYHHNSASARSFRHYKSIVSVVKNHVFFLQKFTKNKKKLFKSLKIKYSYKLYLSLFLNKELNTIKFVIQILKNLFFYPTITLKLFFKVIFKFLNS